MEVTRHNNGNIVKMPLLDENPVTQYSNHFFKHPKAFEGKIKGVPATIGVIHNQQINTATAYKDQFEKRRKTIE